MTNRRPPELSRLFVALPALLALVALLAAGCAFGPPTDPTRPPSAAVPVTTPGGAMAAIVAVDPRFAGIGTKDPAMIGQSAWYEALPASGVGAFVVTIQVGWGDCPAGCIDRHTWQYAVTPDGHATLMSETGSPLVPGVLPSEAKVGTGILVRATVGPICPVERVPPDPACVPRPVAEAVVVVRTPAGAEVSRASTNADGTVRIALGSGSFVIAAEPVAGYMGTPASMPVTLSEGQILTVELAYDTGIR